jgi:hypothetical protein
MAAEVPYAVRAAQYTAGRDSTRAVAGPLAGAGSPVPPGPPAMPAMPVVPAVSAAPVPAGLPMRLGAAAAFGAGQTGSSRGGRPGGSGTPGSGGFGGTGTGGYQPSLASPGPMPPASMPPGSMPPGSMPLGAPVAGSAPVDAVTGLPRRRPGILLAPGHVGGVQPANAADDPSRPPDPETIRARLSGLASGLAAAAKHTSRPPS